MALLDTVPTPTITFEETTTPTNPPSGDQAVFVDSVDHKLKRVDDTGTVVDIESAGGAFTPAIAKALITGGNYTTTSNSFTDVDATNAKLALTTGAHRVLVGVIAVLKANTVGLPFMCLDLDLDSARLGTSGIGLAMAQCSQNNAQTASFTFLTEALSAGSHTFKLQWCTQGAESITLYASDPALVMWAVEQNG
jgi:hypothetical protein